MPTHNLRNDYLLTKLMHNLRTAIERHELDSFARQFIDADELV